MSCLIVWGRTRELVAGDLPLGLTLLEAASLAQIQVVLDRQGTALVLADPALIEAERAAVEEWLERGAKLKAVLVAVVEAGRADDVLQRLAFLDDVMMKPVTPQRLRLRLERAFESLHGRRALEQLEAALARKGR